jgi:hypothetical protein
MFKIIQTLADYIVRLLVDELEQQGHRYKGELQDTMRAIVTKTGSGYQIEIEANAYAEQMENGIPPGVWVNPYALAEWVEGRGIATGEKEIKSIAFAIRAKIHKEGSPTRNAVNFSANGRRKGFISVVLDEKGKTIEGLVEELFGDFVNLQIDNAIKKL